MYLKNPESKQKQRIDRGQTEPTYQAFLNRITTQGAFSSTVFRLNARKLASIFFLLVALVAGYLISVPDASAQQTPIVHYDESFQDHNHSGD